jgi:hypothetical protein
MEWEEVKSSMRYVVFGDYKAEKDKDQQYLMKEGDTLYCIVAIVADSNFIPGKKYMTLELTDEKGKAKGEQVSLTPPRYLEVQLGLDPEHEQKKVVGTGDRLMIQYLGRLESKEGKPYTFRIAYGKGK